VSNANVEDIYELSPLQQGLLLHSMHDGAPDMYLSQHTYSIDGPLDPEALVRGWEAVAAAQPVLRTSFHWQGMDKPLQVVHRDVALPVYRHDWSRLGDDRQPEQLRQLQAEDRAVGFNPEIPPLQRLHVIRLGDGRHKVIWTYHHVLMDGWSVPCFLDEVMAQYRCLTLGTPPPPSVPAYRDYIAWLQRQDLREAHDFWATTLANVSPCHVTQLGPAERQRGTGPVGRRIVSLPAALTDGLRQAAGRHRVTFSTMLQAVWAIVLQLYVGRPEIVFGCVTSGRPADLPQIDRMVGVFANTLPLRVTVPSDGDLGSWLRDLQGTYAAMRRYEYTPLAEIKRRAGVPGQQLFDSLLVLENYSLTIDASTGSDTEAEPLRLHVDSLYDKIDVPLMLTVAPDPVSEMHLLIHQERFEPGFLDDILNRVRLTLEALITAERIAPVVSAAGPRPARQAEPIPAPARELPSTPTPPATPEEQAIAAVYQEILDVADIDVTLSFFELGGDSLQAVRAVNRIDGASVAMLDANPSVRELARAVAHSAGNEPESDLDDEIAELEQLLAAKRAARTRRAKPGPIVPVARGGALPCTHQQDGLWFLHQLDPTSTVYHVPHALRLHGALDVPALERAITSLVVRHEALRTRFVERDGLPHQVVDPPPTALTLPVTEVDAERAGQWATYEAHRPFDLATGPLFRAALARLGPDEHALVLVAHHIVADGWSAGILAEELAVLYAGGEAQLPPLDVQAADHAVWQRGWLDGAELDRQLTYWRSALADLPTVDFPTDRPRPAQPTGAGAAITRRLPDDLATAARAYARAHRVSFLAVLHAALLTVLHRYTGQDDIAIGSVFSGRTRAEIEPVIGYFANTLVLRTGAGGRPSFAELMNRSHTTVLNAIERQDVPFGLVVDALQPERVAGRNPLFQIGLILLPASVHAGIVLGDVAGDPIQIADEYSRFDIFINVFDAGNRLDLAVEYSTELFDADRIERLLDHYTAALANGLAAPGTPADDIDIMPAAEQSLVLHTWNDTARHQAELVRRLGGAAAEPTPGAGAAAVPFGPPNANMRAYVLDGRLRPLPIGVPGQLFIGGPVAHGCPGGPGLTAERFLPDPYANRPGHRMYASGELARWRSDGTIELLGRTDRRAGLRGQHMAAPPNPAPPARQHVPPRTDSERWLAAQWQDLLGAELVGAHDNFFDLGANSLHATQLFARIREDLRIELDPRHMFTSQVLEQLAARLDESDRVTGIGAIVPVARGGALPCTHQQESLWFIHQLDPASTVYHLPYAVRLRGPADIPAMERSILALISRHEALRTRFVAPDGQPRQVIDQAPEDFSLDVTDLTADEVTRWAVDQAQRPFDLAAGPLFRAAAARLAPDEHALVLVIHHIVADGWSLRIMADEFSQLYAAEVGGGEAQLAPLHVQPADHAVWQRARLGDAELDRQVAYWREVLAGLPTVDFPTDRPRPARPTGAGASLRRQVPDDVATAARDFARSNQVSFLAVMHAALLIVLHRYTGQDDVTIGSVFSGRTHPELEPVVGFFVNTLVLRTDLAGKPSFAELVRRCHDTVMGATERQDVPFGLIVDALQPDRILGRNPLFQISLTLQPAAAQPALALGDVTAEPIELPGGDARFDIALEIVDSSGRGDRAVEYSTELFDADRMERLLGHYTSALTHGLAAPGIPADEIDIMSAAETHQVLHVFNLAPTGTP
jgi:non-ribosomal peptide synthetase component F